MKGDGGRRARVARTLQAELAELIRGLSDPRIAAAGLPSINHVDVNVDYSVAEIYVSFIGGSSAAAAPAIEALGGAAARLRGPLGRRMNLRRAPELRFHFDRSVDFGARLSEIVADDERRAHPRPSDEPEGEGEE